MPSDHTDLAALRVERPAVGVRDRQPCVVGRLLAPLHSEVL